MARRYTRPDKADFRYKIIMGVFIAALLMGIAGVIYFGMHYSKDAWLFWASLVWTVFYAATIYCWTDEDRYARYEYFMIPVMFGALFLLLIAFCIGGLAIYVPEIAAGRDVLTNILTLLIAEGSLGAFAFFTYKFFLKEYIDKLFHKGGH